MPASSSVSSGLNRNGRWRLRGEFIVGNPDDKFPSQTATHSTGAAGIAPARNDKRVAYQLAEAGVSATYTVRLIKYSVLDLGE